VLWPEAPLDNAISHSDEKVVTHNSATGQGPARDNSRGDASARIIGRVTLGGYPFVPSQSTRSDIERNHGRQHSATPSVGAVAPDQSGLCRVVVHKGQDAEPNKVGFPKQSRYNYRHDFSLGYDLLASVPHPSPQHLLRNYRTKVLDVAACWKVEDGSDARCVAICCFFEGPVREEQAHPIVPKSGFSRGGFAEEAAEKL